MDESQIKNIFLDELINVISVREFVTDAIIVFIIFLGALGLVYLLGRMFGLVNSIRGRNIVAFIAMFIFTSIYVFVLNKPIPSWASNNQILLLLYLYIPDISKLIILILIEVLIYVLLGMRLYSRIDHILDKHIAEDSVELGQDVFADEYKKKQKKNSKKK